jgi:hypothetical protein
MPVKSLNLQALGEMIMCADAGSSFCFGRRGNPQVLSGKKSDSIYFS